MSHRSSLASIAALSLLFLALCCQVTPLGHVHDAMTMTSQPFAHALLLIMHLPPISLILAFFVCAMTIRSASSIADSTPSQNFTGEQRRPLTYRPPLEMLFADGILNTKRYATV